MQLGTEIFWVVAWLYSAKAARTMQGWLQLALSGLLTLCEPQTEQPFLLRTRRITLLSWKGLINMLDSG